MLTYFHSGSPERVRAPQTRMLRPGKTRRVLMPELLRVVASALVRVRSSDAAPRIGWLAGALETPRWESERAKMPATKPEGGALMAAARVGGARGLATLTHG
jgi:hypothetical protein